MTKLFGEVLTLPLDSPTRRLAKLGGRAPWGSDFDVWFQTCVHRDAARRFPSAGGAVAALASSLGVLELAHTGRRIATRRVSTLLLAIEEPRSDLEAAVHTGAALARTRDAASRPGRGLSWAAGILLSSVTVAMAAFVILRRWPSPGPSTPAGMASLAATTALVPEPTNVFPSVSTPIPAAISSQDAPPTAAEFPPRLAVTQAAQLLSRAAPRARPAAQNRPAPVPSASASASPIPTSGRRTPDLYGER
jgi:hypothetical protein